MSVQAWSWLLEDAPDLPKHLFGCLAGLANHADQDGRNSYPGQDLLAWYARKDERSIRRDLEQLLELDLIRIGNQAVVSYLPADKRPVVYDLAMDRSRGPRPGRRTPGRPKKDREDAGDTLFEIQGTPTSPRLAEPPLTCEENRGDVHVRGDAHVKIGGTPTSNRGDAHVPLTVLEPSFEPPPPPHPPSQTPGNNPAEEAEEVNSGEEDQRQALITEVRRHAPYWKLSKLVEVLEHPDVDGVHPLPVIRQALLSLAQGIFGHTASPRRLIEDGPWWERAYRDLGLLGTPAASGDEPLPTQRADKPCQQPECADGLIWVRTGDASGDDDVSVSCPRCRPREHARQLQRARSRDSGVETFDDLLALVAASQQPR